jgi:hypothetical protein
VFPGYFRGILQFGRTQSVLLKKVMPGQKKFPNRAGFFVNGQLTARRAEQNTHILDTFPPVQFPPTVMPKSMNHNFKLSDRAAAAPVGTMGGAPEAEVDDHTKTARRATRATIKKKVRKK